MKRSFVIIAGLSGVIIVSGWMQHRRLAELEQEYRREQEIAAAIGLGPSSSGDDSLPANHPARPEKGAGAEALLSRLGSLKRAEEFPDDQTPVDLGAADLDLLSRRLLAGDGIDPELRLKLVRNLVRLYATRYPEMMLKLYSASPEFSAGQAGAPYLVGAALKQWGSVDPLAAAAWVREMAEKMPQLVNAGAKMGIIEGAARANPAAAMSLAADLGLEDELRAWSGIGEAVKTPGEWSSLLAVVRNYNGGSEGDGGRQARVKAILEGLGRSVFAGGFQDASLWLDGSGLSDGEKAVLVGELHPWFSKKETGQWLDWLGKNVHGEDLDGKGEELMGEWARKDYAAAGEWLKNVPAGSLRDASIVGYAGALASYEPDAASEWAMQLPQGEKRIELLRKICEAWNRKDPAAAAGFARRAGLSGP